MDSAIIIQVTGAQARDTAYVLVKRLIERGRKAELLGPEAAALLGGAQGLNLTASVLARNGVFPVAAEADAALEGDVLECAVEADDTPDFAAEKILEALAEEGLISSEAPAYSEEEEAEIQRRLADLGYIE